MGGNQFTDRKETELCNQQFVIIITHFQELQSINNKHYGQHDVYKDKSSYHLVLKELIQTTYEEFVQHVQHWDERVIKYVHPTTLQVHAFYKGNGDQTCQCGSVWKVNLLIDYINSTLEDEMKLKTEYKEEELWNLLDSVISGVSFLQQNQMKHCYLKLSSIYNIIQQNGQKVYKIADSQLMSYPTLFEELYLANPKDPEAYRNMYPSPNVLRAIALKERQPNHNNYKSDVFSLGMIILHLASWQPSDDCYDWQNFRINDFLVQDKINRIKHRFTPELTMVLQEMLKFDENFRPDFNMLDQKLNQINALKGKRVIQILKPTNLPEFYHLLSLGQHQPGQHQALISNPLQTNTQQASYLQHQTPPVQQQQVQSTANNTVAQNNNIQNQTQTPLANQQNQQQFQSSLPLNNVTNQIQNQTLLQQQQQGQKQNFIYNKFNQSKSFSVPPSSMTNNNTHMQSHVIPQNQYSQSFTQNINPTNSIHSQHPQENNYQNNKNQFQQAFPNSNSNNNNYGSFYTQNQSSGYNGVMQSNNYMNSFNSNNNFNNNNVNNLNPNQFNNFQNQGQNNGFYPQNSPMNNNPLFGYNNNNNGEQLSSYNNFQPNAYNIHNFNNIQPQIHNPGLLPLNFGAGNMFANNLLFPPQNLQMNQFLKSQKKTPSPRNSKSISDQKGLAQKFKYTDGSVYFGEVLNGKRHGYGQLEFPSKVFYEGNWKEDKMEGKGTLYYQKGQIAYEGEWSQDKFNNFGKYYNKSPTVLNTPFDYKDFNKLNNYWIKYEGDFKFDQKEGFGVLFMSNGEKFSGNFLNDEAHGYGTYQKLNKETVSGHWLNNKLEQQ